MWKHGYYVSDVNLQKMTTLQLWNFSVNKGWILHLKASGKRKIQRAENSSFALVLSSLLPKLKLPPHFWHPGRIQLPQLCSSMNSKSLLPVTVDAHHQRGSVTLLSVDEFPARLEEHSFMGEGHEIPEIRNIALSTSEPRQLLVPVQSPDWMPVSVALLQKCKLYLWESSPREGPLTPLLPQMSCGKLNGVVATHHSKLELTKKAIACTGKMLQQGCCWKEIQKINGFSLNGDLETAKDIFRLV